MTTAEMIRDVFENAGEPSDLEIDATPGDPTTFSIALDGSQKILRYLNIAQTRISNWVYRDGSISRFKSLYRNMYLKTKDPLVQMVTSFTADSVVVDGYSGANVDGSFDGWTLEITDGTGVGQSRVIVSSIVSGAAIELTVDTDFDTEPDLTTEVTLRKSFFDFVPQATANTYLEQHISLSPGEVLTDVIRVMDVGSRVTLDRSTFGDSYPANAYEVGIPTEFLIYGNRLQFNAVLDTPRSYNILYYRNPLLLSAADQRSELPEAFHEAVVLYATHKIKIRHGDYEGQYVDKQNLATLMESIKEEGVLSNEAEMGIITVI